MKKIFTLLGILSITLLSYSCNENELDEIQVEEELNDTEIQDENASGGSGGIILTPDPIL